MNYKLFLSKLDGLVSDGMLLEAVERYFDPSVRTYSNNADMVIGKDDKLKQTHAFVESIAKANDIILHNHSISDEVSFSEFTFDFTLKNGERLLMNEIIRRQWKDGKVVEERYFPGDDHKTVVQTVFRNKDREVPAEITLIREVANVVEHVVDTPVEHTVKLTRQVPVINNKVIEKKVPVIHETVVEKEVIHNITLEQEVAVVKEHYVDVPVNFDIELKIDKPHVEQKIVEVPSHHEISYEIEKAIVTETAHIKEVPFDFKYESTSVYTF